MIQTTTKKEFQESILNGERAFLLYIDEKNKAWIQADMEDGGDPPRYRVELMNFCLDVTKPILYATVECRGFYCGGISFIEYDAENTIDLAVHDFINLSENAMYIICDDMDLSAIANKYADCYVYVYVR